MDLKRIILVQGVIILGSSRFPIATLVLIAVMFIMLAGYGIMSFVHETIDENIDPFASDNLDSYSYTKYSGEVQLIKNGFGVFTVIFFILAIISYLVDVLRREPEYYEY